MMDQDKFDEFDDIDLDDIEDLDDDWGDMEDEPAEKPMKKSKKKSSSSSLFTLFVVLIALVIGGYILYTTFKPMLDARTNTASANANRTNDNVVQNETRNNETKEEIDASSFLQDDGLPPMPAPLSGDNRAASSPDLTPLPEFDDIELEPLPDLKRQASAPISATPQSVQPSPSPTVIESDVAVAAQDVTLLNTRLETIQSEMTSQLSERDFQLDLLNEKMERLEKMLIDMELQLSKVPAASNTARAVQPKVTKSAPKKKTTAITAIDKPPVSSAKKIVKAPRKKAPVKKKKIVKKAITWQLRSALPGKATVSPKGSNDIRSVGVGDTLSGIGRIQSISNASGKWIVTGTTGSISQ